MQELDTIEQNEQIEQELEQNVEQSEPTESAEAELDLVAELERERAIRKMSENKLHCIKLLKECSLPSELCDYLTGDSEAETQKRVKEVSAIIKKAVNDEVKSRLATIHTPSQGKTAMTKARFKTLSLAERQRLYLSDKELYRQLSKN